MRKISLHTTRHILLAVVVALLTTHYLLPTAMAARLYFYPDKLDVIAGGSFVVELRINTEGESINAVDITGNIENGIIESVTTANSLIEIFIDAAATDRNSFRFAGGTPGGFTGEGIVGRLNITATVPGSLNISINDSSKLLAGTGEEIKLGTKIKTAEMDILQPSANHIIITSRTHPNQNIWYDKKDLHLHWDLEEGVEYSYLVSLDPLAVPDDSPDRPSGTLLWQGDINIDGLEEGIYYFTLKRLEDDNVVRYRAQIDTTPPEWAAFEKSEGVPETNYKDFVTFFAKDALSGISHYEASIDGKKSQIITVPYILPDEYTKITITALDNAGNKAERTITSKTQKNITIIYAVAGIIVLISIIALLTPTRRIFTKEN